MNLPLLLAAHWSLAQPLAVYLLTGFVVVLVRYGWDAVMEEKL